MNDHSLTNGSGSSPFSVGRIFTLLVLLTLATFGSLFIQQRFHDQWSPTTNTVFILLVATAKASLVLFYFMHWRYERSWKYVLTIPTLILAIVAVLALMPDIAFDSYERASWQGP